MKNLPLAARNLGRACLRSLWNRGARQYRHWRWRVLRLSKHASESGKGARASLKLGMQAVKDASVWTHRGGVRLGRYWSRTQQQTTARLRRDIGVRRDLRAAARGDQPIIVGPWLSEVGYEALYWVPFMRWFCDRYRVAPSRLVVVSRGGVASWYRDVADRYVELLDLFSADEFTALNADRQREGEQKQHRLTRFDEEILRRVRAQDGLASASVCHPSAMFRLLREFWLGNESLDYLQAHLRYAPAEAPPLPDGMRLPERFVAIKFYTGAALPPTAQNHASLRQLVTRMAARTPVVALETGLTLDEHRDYGFRDVPGVVAMPERLTPRNNLAIQTAIIGRANAFVGTCGGLAWLAPMLGTPTLGVYSDDELLTPHLYAARCTYRAMSAAPFAAIDLHALSQLETGWDADRGVPRG